jgi:segregation and condensation protein B
MSLKAKLEAIIYATEEPVTLNELAALLKDSALAEAPAEAAHEGTEAGIVPEPVSDKDQLKAVKARITSVLDELIADYNSPERGMEIRQVAGGYRMATKPEHHDVVVSFAKSLKPPVRLSLQALETLAVIAYKQPVTVPEISEIRGVDSAGVIATLLDRKLITTAGRKQVIGRPILYKTTKEFLLRFGLKDVSELPSVEEFEKLGEPQAELFNSAAAHTEDEPATEAVPDPAHHVAGDTAVPADGTFATEAEPQQAEEKL